MHSTWYHVYGAQIERQREFRLRAEADTWTARWQRDSAPAPSGSFEVSLAGFARDMLRLAIRNPRLARRLLILASRQRAAARQRSSWEAKGVHVPPLLIASITETCNLRCRGCYARVHRRGAAAELSDARWLGLFREASQLGTAFVLVAGGEPLARWAVVEAAAAVPETLFVVFTNGMLIGPPVVETFRRSGNIVPVVSLEGPGEATDARRGPGVYGRVMQSMGLMRRAGMLFGASITVTSENLELATDPSFVDGLVRAGCRIVIFVEYTPVEEATEALAPRQEQRAELDRRVRELHRRGRALFVSFPGDEEQYGGCLAAGRGFVHVSSQGRLEPCPFAPFSDASVREASLREALASPLLARIRSAHEQLTETSGGCALWARREWVRSLVADGVGTAASAAPAACGSADAGECCREAAAG